MGLTGFREFRGLMGLIRFMGLVVFMSFSIRCLFRNSLRGFRIGVQGVGPRGKVLPAKRLHQLLDHSPGEQPTAL